MVYVALLIQSFITSFFYFHVIKTKNCEAENETRGHVIQSRDYLNEQTSTCTDPPNPSLMPKQ